ITTNGWPVDNPVAPTAIINPDDGTYQVLPLSDPSVPVACYIWSPDGKRLACQLFSPPGDPSQSGMYSIRSSDGGGLTQITSTPPRATPRLTEGASSSRASPSTTSESRSSSSTPTVRASSRSRRQGR